ncbi:hypothetical protein BD769DRAFT_1676138 [Suillus cothurnatus]|nr:hypothetical protein BD769DRAFT_1676138 [Suillus cothurnatus]
MSDALSVGSTCSLCFHGLPTMGDMDSQDNASSCKAATHWKLEEERELISFLATCKSEAGDTMSFKSSLSCKTKWSNLKKTYNVVKNIKSLSGFAWSEEHGVGVTPETSGTLDAHTKVHPQSKPFAHKGFLHFHAVEALMLTATRGKFVTCQPHARRVASISTAPSSSSSMPPPVKVVLKGNGSKGLRPQLYRIRRSGWLIVAYLKVRTTIV